jgi:predicted ATPase
LAQAQGFPLWLGLGTAVNGWALIEQGQTEEGIVQVRQGLEIYQAIGTELSKSFFLLLLAEAYRRTEQIAEGLTLLAQAQEFMETTGERLYEAEAYRIKGELILQKGAGGRAPSPQAPSLKPQAPMAVEEAEGYFLKAIAIAQRQQAKSLELLAVMSVVRLRQQQTTQHATQATQGATRVKLDEARQMLSEVYHWFTEGFDTKNLRDAKALLATLEEGSV